MSDQSTRAPAPNPDPRQPFTLGQGDAQALYDLASDPAKDANELNAWWLEAGQRLGFVWTTVQELVLCGDSTGTLASATFTAWPTETEWQPDPDAEAWLADMVAVGDPTTLKNRELILRAFSAGSDHGFAMGVATVPDPGLGWDGMELLAQAADSIDGVVSNVDGLEHDTSTAETVRDRIRAFLADPSQSHLVHDGLREARGDAALGVMVGWEAAIVAVRELVNSGRATMGSAMPPLVFLSHLEKLEAPEDMDEMLGPWRGVSEAIARIADMRGEKPAWASIVQGGGWHPSAHLRWAADAVRAWREYHDKAEWVRELVRLDVPKSLGMPPQWGAHTMDTARDLVAQLNKLLVQAVSGQIVGLHVQAAADVLQATGIGKSEPVPGVYSPDQGERDPGAAGLAMRPEGIVRTSPRYPIAEGLECADTIERPFLAWSASSFADGDIVEVREKDGHCHPMKVGSIQFRNALAELGERMPVRAATDEQRKGWEG